MRIHHSRKRPRSQEGKDRRTSPYSLLSKLPISESLDERYVPSTGITRRQQRRLDRKAKRKGKSNAYRTDQDKDEQASGTHHENPASDFPQSKGEQPKDLQSDSVLLRKRRKPNRSSVSRNGETQINRQIIGTNKGDKPKDCSATEKQDTISTVENPDSREVRRLERLLGVRKQGVSSRSSNKYEGIFDETETDLLDLLNSCDQTLNRTLHTAQSNHAEEESIMDEKDQDSELRNGSTDSSVESLPSEEEEGIPENDGSDIGTSAMDSEESQEDIPYIAKWKRGGLNRGRSQSDPQSRFSIKALQGLLNRVSHSNTTDIAEKISSLYPKDMSTAEKEEVSSSYVVAVLEAINQGNTMGSINPYLRAHVEVVCILGTTIDMTLLSKFITATIKRLSASLELDGGSTLSESASSMSHIFGYIVALCAAYELGVLSSGFMYETLIWIAKPLCKTRLDAELKFLQEAGPLLRKKDPVAFVDVVKFIHGQSEPEDTDSDAKSSSNEASCKLNMLTDVVENIRNNRIKVVRKASRSVEISRAHLPFQASLSQLLDDDFTSTRWWDDTKQNVSARKGPRDGHRRTDVEIDHDSSRISRLATALRLHTDSRRGLLAAVMNSTSCPDAIQRIAQLGAFSSKQRLKDLTFIVTHCCRTEQPYNKFYALLANRICQKSREARFAMEFTIQDAAKDTDCYDSADRLGRKTKNLARYLGDLWASEGLPLSMLRRVHDLEDISVGEQYFYTASFGRMIFQREAAGVDPLAAFKRLKKETVARGDLFCSSLAIFLRRHVHTRMSASEQELVAKAISELERKP